MRLSPPPARVSIACQRAMCTRGGWRLPYYMSSSPSSMPPLMPSRVGRGRQACVAAPCGLVLATLRASRLVAIRGMPAGLCNDSAGLPRSELMHCISVASTPPLILLFSRGPFSREPLVKSPTMLPGSSQVELKLDQTWSLGLMDV